MLRRTLFRDRRDAGAKLADALRHLVRADALVLGLARGGVVVAAESASLLHADLDAVVVRKLGAPGSPELAVGAVTANGGRYINEDVIRELNVRDDYIDAITSSESAEARRQEWRIRDGRPLRPIEGRVVILVDDGLATGATMLAAARSVAHQGPRRLIIAVPVASREGCEAVAPDADDVICLHVPHLFRAVGLYYGDFKPVHEDEVRAALEQIRQAPAVR